MKVVHVPFGYFPRSVGGTEVYVAELARGLRARGVDSVVAAPGDGLRTDRYEHEGTPVYRFGIDPSTSVAELYGDGDEGAARTIVTILDDVGADVLHLHSFTRAASLRAARLARRHGVAVVFTYHTPTASCVRGTLLRDGRAPCDGALIAQRCTSCLLESRGVAPVIRGALSRAPVALGSAIAASGLAGPWATALRARELTTARHTAFRQLLQEADAIVAVCEWVRALLVGAGAPPNRLMLSRQGTPACATAPKARESSVGPLRLAFIGRLHPTKGVHVLVDAVVSQPDLDATLDIYGDTSDPDGKAYRDEVLAAVAGDPRIHVSGSVPSERVVELLASYDATVVPSQWLETGPLTVLESFAAGVPVVGSNLGGVAELVTHDCDGWLVQHADRHAWRVALRRLVDERAVLDRLRSGVRRPRSTDDVARDMVSVYEAIVARRSRRTVATAGVA